MLIRLVEANEGDTDNWIEFSCYNSALDVNRLFHISFCGTEIHHNMSLTNECYVTIKTDPGLTSKVDPSERFDE